MSLKVRQAGEAVHPKSRIRERWDHILLIVLVYMSLSLPFSIGFDIKSSAVMTSLNIFTDIIFGLDVCFNFVTGYP